MPSLLGFKHVGVEVRLVADGKIAVKRGTFGACQPAQAWDCQGSSPNLNSTRCAATAAASYDPAASLEFQPCCHISRLVLWCSASLLRATDEVREGAAFGDLLERIRGAQHAAASAVSWCCAVELDTTLAPCTWRRRVLLQRCCALRSSCEICGKSATAGPAQYFTTEPYIADGAFGEDKKLQAEFRRLVRSEMETAKALLKGKAIKEHMEDSYCEMVAVSPQGLGQHTPRSCIPSHAAKLHAGVASCAACAGSRWEQSARPTCHMSVKPCTLLPHGSSSCSSATNSKKACMV